MQVAKRILELLPAELASLAAPETEATEFLHHRQFFAVWAALARARECAALEQPQMNKDTRAAWLADYGGLVERAREALLWAWAVGRVGGLDDAWAMIRYADRLSSTPGAGEDGPHSLVMSTGVIGQRLPIARMLGALEAGAGAAGTLDASFGAWERAARAFMTTDTFPKLHAQTFKLNGREYRMAGMDKGAGMIHPDMAPALPHATLLGCVVTDAAVAPKALQKALAYAVDRSFNSISVDGDMSTNDTIVALANGAAGGKELTAEDPAFPAFQEELKDFTVQLAQLVVRDGEGATKFVTVSVKNAPTYEDAHKIASKISTSALVKTALFGEDAK